MQVSLSILFKLVQLYLYIVNAGVLCCAIFAAIVGLWQEPEIWDKTFFQPAKTKQYKISSQFAHAQYYYSLALCKEFVKLAVDELQIKWLVAKQPPELQ